MQFLIDLGLSLFYLVIFLLLCAWTWRFWMMYINQKFLDNFNKDCILLEIKLPRDIFKSPLATEVAIASLLQGGGISTWYSKNFDGNLPQYASLEIASLEGIIHFYVRIHKKYKPLVEANFYAQYPGIEIVEADDYTKMIRYHHLTKDVSMWGGTFKLAKDWDPVNPKTGDPYSKTEKGKPKDKEDTYKMQADFLPMKTYVDFGLDKDPKEEFKTDPITPLLEFMGGIRKGEYFWYQVLVQDEGVYNGTKMPKFYVNERTHEHVSLKEMADAYKKKIRTSHYVVHDQLVMDDYGYEKPPRKIPDGVDKEGKPKFKEVPLTYNLGDKKDEAKAISKDETKLTIENKEDIEAINQKLSKPLALVVIRLVYVAKKDNFDGKQIQNILSFVKPYKGGNGLAPKTLTDPYDFPWQKIGGKRVNWRTEEMFDAYVEREGFFPHTQDRTSLDRNEDLLFYPYSMKTRKIFRMIYEGIFSPFDHPFPKEVSTMNLEEIATLWHLPGQVAGVPTLPRIDSVKGNPPPNLPM